MFIICVYQAHRVRINALRQDLRHMKDDSEYAVNSRERTTKACAQDQQRRKLHDIMRLSKKDEHEWFAHDWEKRDNRVSWSTWICIIPRTEIISMGNKKGDSEAEDEEGVWTRTVNMFKNNKWLATRVRNRSTAHQSEDDQVRTSANTSGGAQTTGSISRKKRKAMQTERRKPRGRGAILTANGNPACYPVDTILHDADTQSSTSRLHSRLVADTADGRIWLKLCGRAIAHGLDVVLVYEVKAVINRTSNINEERNITLRTKRVRQWKLAHMDSTSGPSPQSNSMLYRFSPEWSGVMFPYEGLCAKFYVENLETILSRSENQDGREQQPSIPQIYPSWTTWPTLEHKEIISTLTDAFYWHCWRALAQPGKRCGGWRPQSTSSRIVQLDRSTGVRKLVTGLYIIYQLYRLRNCWLTLMVWICVGDPLQKPKTWILHSIDEGYCIPRWKPWERNVPNKIIEFVLEEGWQ